MVSVIRRLGSRKWISGYAQRVVAHLKAREDDWFEWVEDDRLDVFVRLAPATDGRLRVSALHVEGPVTAGLLRLIPIGRIEAAANASFHHQHQNTVSTASQVDPRIPDDLRRVDGRGRPDSFYESVAAVYRQLSATTAQPVALLAEANEVPRTTAHRWVKESRRRGLLPPGRPGKAG